jgi:CHASE3 domain sensor protein
VNDERATRRDQLLSELHKLLRQARQNLVGSPEREKIVNQMEPLYRLIFALGEELDER